MTGIVLRNLVRSQRTVGVIVLTIVVMAIVLSNRPQAPGSALAATALLMLPVHAWGSLAAAAGTDASTRDAFVAAFGVRRVMVGHLMAATVVGAVSDLVVVGIAVATHVMSPPPSPDRWVAGAMVAGASLALGIAIGAAAGPPVVTSRGTRVVLLVGLVAVAPLLLPLVRMARLLDEARSSMVIAEIAGPAALTAGAAAVLLIGAVLVAQRRL